MKIHYTKINLYLRVHKHSNMQLTSKTKPDLISCNKEAEEPRNIHIHRKGNTFLDISV